MIIEHCDLPVTGVIAATIWGNAFFKLLKLAAAMGIYGMGIYGIGVTIRPIGAYLFGHLADRHGRNHALIHLLVPMGVSALLIRLAPGYEAIGTTAAALLILFRLVQGISFGAEFDTAATSVAAQAARLRFRASWRAWLGFAIPSACCSASARSSS